MQLLVSSHVWSRDKALLRGILSGSVWNGFLLSKVRGENVPCRFCGGLMATGICFGIVLFLLWSIFVKVLSSAVLLTWMSLTGHVVFSGMGGYPALSGSTFGNTWAEDATRISKNQQETVLASYVPAHRHPFGDFRLGERDFDVGDGPFVWSDGSLVVDKVSGVGVAGAGVYAHISGAPWFNRRWAHLDLLPPLLDEREVRGVGCIVLSQVLFSQFSGLRFGRGFGCHSRVRLLYMLEWTI